MPRANHILSNFTAGELSPRMEGRTDLGKYHNGCHQLQNFLVFPHGGITRRGGFRYIADVKTASRKVRLIEFEFSTEQAYILEFGHLYIRFYMWDSGSSAYGQIESATPGTPCEVTTTYTEDELFEIDFAQSADILFLAHQNHAPAKLSRGSAHNIWTLANISFTSAPTVWGANDYPGTISFYEQRLWWAGSPSYPQTLWASKSGDYYDLTMGTAADDACEYTIATDQVNAVLWLSSGKVLACGTTGGEFTITSSNLDEAITPTNIRIVRQSTYGSARIKPLRISDLVLFVQRAQRKIRQFIFQFESDSYVAPDLSLLSEHITIGEISEIAYQQEPDSVVWCVRGDGALLGLTYQRDQEVIGWHKHLLGGTDTEVESVACIFGPSGSGRNDVFVSVKRTVNGSTTRTIEVMDVGMDTDEGLEEAFFVDSGLSYDGSPATTISGLTHLEGETVAVLADGEVITGKTVSSGSITLSTAASKVHVGLAYDSIMQTMRIDAGSADGSAQGKTKRISKVTARLYRTTNLLMGPDESNLDQITPDEGALFTGDESQVYPGSFETEGRIMVKQNKPIPATILSLIANLKTNG